MIAKQPGDCSRNDHASWHKKMDQLFSEAVEDALEASRREGVPIPREVAGKIQYELPDGSVVDEDPWNGEKTAPDGWYDRFGIERPGGSR